MIGKFDQKEIDFFNGQIEFSEDHASEGEGLGDLSQTAY